MRFLEFVLHEFGKALEDFASLVSDNCSTYRLIGNITDILLIGCASHRFPIALKDLHSEKKPIIEQVHTLMANLRPRLISARLQQRTFYKKKIRNVTRWTSTFEMLQQYLFVYVSICLNYVTTR